MAVDGALPQPPPRLLPPIAYRSRGAWIDERNILHQPATNPAFAIFCFDRVDRAPLRPCTPTWCDLGSCFVHHETPLRVLGGSRCRVSWMDVRIRQTSTASPAEPGGLLSY